MGGLAKRIMGGGISAGAAKAINGDIRTGISAAGTTQGTATELTAAENYVSTVASGAGVKLLSCEISDEQGVYNAGANALTLYPDSGSKINGGAANGSISLATNTYIRFKRLTSTQWVGLLSA